ncbi:hypothetical protein [Nonomuraea rubra]|uniref:hypothetical protein n=1 Tax=Nonomuraea rubra TaxID=46180 RepID=UPI0033E22E21
MRTCRWPSASRAARRFGKAGHLTPVERFAWDLRADPADLGMGRNPVRYAEAAAALFERAKAEGRPFFLMANAEDPHRPYHGSAAEQVGFTPEQRATMATPSRVYTPARPPCPAICPTCPASARSCRSTSAAPAAPTTRSPPCSPRWRPPG